MAEVASEVEPSAVARPVTPNDRETLRQLAEAYPFSPYRNYRAFAPEVQLAATQADLAEALEAPKGRAVIVPNGDNPAAAVARHLAWDSGFFGVEMARLDYVLGKDPVARKAALKGVLDQLRASGVRHVAARVDAADHRTALLLQEHAFRYVGALLTHVARPGKEEPRAVREVGTVRPYEPGDSGELVALATEAFAGTASRFHVDPNLPKGRADTFYTEWAKACVSGSMADTILVAEDDDRMIGFLAFRTVNPISKVSGAPVFGGGLGACRAGSGGAYAGLIKAGTLWAHQHGAIAEVQTPADNSAAIHIFESVGFSHRRTDYLFHLWFAESADSQASG